LREKAVVSEQAVITNLANQLASMQVTLAMKDAYIQQLENELHKDDEDKGAE